MKIDEVLIPLDGSTTPILLLHADGAPVEPPVGTAEERGGVEARR